MKQTDNKWLEGLEKGGLLYFYLVSLISSDELITEEDCDESLREIEHCLEILPENNIQNKEKIEEMLIQGKEIVIKEREKIKNGRN